MLFLKPKNTLNSVNYRSLNTRMKISSSIIVHHNGIFIFLRLFIYFLVVVIFFLVKRTFSKVLS